MAEAVYVVIVATGYEGLLEPERAFLTREEALAFAATMAARVYRVAVSPNTEETTDVSERDDPYPYPVLRHMDDGVIGG